MDDLRTSFLPSTIVALMVWPPSRPRPRRRDAADTAVLAGLDRRGLITANDDWTAVPESRATAATGLTGATGVDPQTVPTSRRADLDVIANQTDPDTLRRVASQSSRRQPDDRAPGSGTADAPYILLDLNTTGQAAVTVAYTLRDHRRLNRQRHSAGRAAVSRWSTGRLHQRAGWLRRRCDHRPEPGDAGDAGQRRAAGGGRQPAGACKFASSPPTPSATTSGSASTTSRRQREAARQPALSVDDVSITEGDTGVVTATFT